MSQFFVSGDQSISFSFSISPSNKYSGLISFRMDWLDLKSLLQYHSSKASILWLSAFFIVQLSHPHKTTGKAIALTIRILVSVYIYIILFVIYIIVLFIFGCTESSLLLLGFLWLW